MIPYFPAVPTRETAICPECLREVDSPRDHWTAAHDGAEASSNIRGAFEKAAHIEAEDVMRRLFPDNELVAPNEPNSIRVRFRTRWEALASIDRVEDEGFVEVWAEDHETDKTTDLVVKF